MLWTPYLSIVHKKQVGEIVECQDVLRCPLLLITVGYVLNVSDVINRTKRLMGFVFGVSSSGSIRFIRRHSRIRERLYSLMLSGSNLQQRQLRSPASVDPQWL
jgi:hypothetical protein